MKIETAAIILVSIVSSAIITAVSRIHYDEIAYNKGYEESTSYFKQTLLDQNYAEYDKKTAEWKLLDAATIQGNLIPPHKRMNYITIEEEIQALEDELRLLKKQKEALHKQKSQSKPKVDFKKL
jgi:hypothetical protein